MSARAQALVLSLMVGSAVVCFYVTGLNEASHELEPARLAAQGKPVPPIVPCRLYPVKVATNPTPFGVVTNEDLLDALNGALPWANPPVLGNILHNLKLWGPNCVFTKKMGFANDRTGAMLVSSLLSDETCRLNTSPNGASYLLKSPFGIRVVQLGSEDAFQNRGEAHFGQLLQILGEAGVPSDSPVSTKTGDVGTIADIYQDAILRFSLEQKELEFIACALAYWHPPRRSWQNQFGTEYNFDSLLLRLTETAHGQGACGGTHLPYAIVTLLRVDEKYHIISNDAVRQRAVSWLKKATTLLETNAATLAWTHEWAHNPNTTVSWRNDVLDQITVTGHHLEWMALAPNQLRVSDEVIRRAVIGLRASLNSLPPIVDRSFKHEIPISHAGRALALLLGTDPFLLWENAYQTKQLEAGPFGYRPKRPSKGKSGE